MVTRISLLRWLPLRAAILLSGIYCLMPAIGFAQQKSPGTNDAKKAWQLLKDADVLITDSLEWDAPLDMILQANALMQDSRDSAFWAESAFDQARCLRRKGIYPQALELLNISTGYWQKNVDHPVDRIGDALIIRGFCLKELKQKEVAWQSLEQALAVFQNTVGEYHFKTASAYNAFGIFREQESDWESATQYYRKAIEINSKIPETLNTCYPYNNLARYYQVLRDFPNAVKYYGMALAIRKRFLPWDHRDVFNNLHSLAYCHSESGNIELAMQLEEEALRIAKSRFGTNSLPYANICAGFGFFSWSTNKNLNSGIKRTEEAIRIFNRIGYGTSGDCGLAYSNLASCYFLKGEREKALLYHQKALQIRTQVFGENDCNNTAISLLNLANSFSSFNDYEKALEYYKKVLAIRLEHCEKYHPNTALAYNNAGNCYMSLDSTAKALEYLSKSVELYASPQLKGHFQTYNPLENLGYYYFKYGDYITALHYFNKALAAAKQSYPAQSPVLARLYLYVVTVHTARQDFNAAQLYLDSAMLAINYSGDVEQVNSRFELINIWRSQAEIRRRQYLATGDISYLPESRSFSEKALGLIYSIAVDYTESLSKSELIRKNYSGFENAIWVENELERLEDHQSEAAFLYAERSKSLALHQSLRENSALSQGGIPDSLLEYEQDLRTQMAAWSRNYREKLQVGLAETDTAVLTIDTVLLHLQQRYERFRNRLDREYPEYVNLKNRVNTINLSYVRDSLLKNDEALLEYFAGDSSIFLIVVLRDTVVLQEIKRDFPLDDWINNFRQGIFGYYTADFPKRSDSLKNETLNLYLNYAHPLYKKLIEPVKQWLPGKLIIAPDGPLGYIPFDALLTGNPGNINDFRSYPYLIHQYQISYTYSATLLAEMRDKKPAGEPEKTLVAFAPFSTNDTLAITQVQLTTRASVDLTPLPYTKAEVEAISQSFNGDIATGNFATVARFRAAADRYRIIHLATHAVADNRPGKIPYLSFSETPDSTDNGRLYIQDIYNLKLNADLVVLSACETGIGKLQRGEGIISLARAFACAGAGSILTSLWAVNDKSTSELMRRFYRELLRNKDKDEALRTARMSLFQTASVRNCHPFFWAAFVPVGDMKPLETR